jgi:hypothetical protein
VTSSRLVGPNAYNSYHGYNYRMGGEKLRKRQPMPDETQTAPRKTAGDPGSVAEFPGMLEGGRPPHNLPLQLSSFIGRVQKVDEVEALLSEHRLLTLTGLGGSGNTRLALTVASEVLDGYQDGVRFVEFAPISDSELVPQALASVLGVREAPGSSLTQTLSEHLLSRTMLLVLETASTS